MASLDPSPRTHALVVRYLDIQDARLHYVLLAARLNLALLCGELREQLHAACVEMTRLASRALATRAVAVRAELSAQQAALEARAMMGGGSKRAPLKKYARLLMK